MNRRDLLKQFAAVPVAAAVALPAVADDGVALYSTAHPTGFTCGKGHPFCNCCGSEVDLSESSLTNMIEQLRGESLETVEIEFPDHEFHPDKEICIHCGATALMIEDLQAPRSCWARNSHRFGSDWWPIP